MLNFLVKKKKQTFEVKPQQNRNQQENTISVTQETNTEQGHRKRTKLFKNR